MNYDKGTTTQTDTKRQIEKMSDNTIQLINQSYITLKD